MQPPNDQPMTDHPPDRRVTVAEAALLLDLSEDAVRSRLKRGTLRRETGPDGTVLVVLGPDGSPDRPTPGQATDQPAQAVMQAHLDSLQDQISHLRRQLEEAHEANRENRRISPVWSNASPSWSPRETLPQSREKSLRPLPQRGKG